MSEAEAEQDAGPDDGPAVDLKQEHRLLSEEVEDARWRYYVQDSPTLSDADYDVKLRRLQAIEDEAPGGKVSRLSGGWQVISDRALDTSKSRYLDGTLIQPFHPFTKAAQKKLAHGEVAPVDVEIFPTRAKILAGHKLRIAVQAFDVPHLLPTLPDLLGSLTVMTIHNSAKYPSAINFPSVGTLPTVK